MANDALIGCGCGAQTTSEVCGTFETPTNPDLGLCSPGAVKRTCEAPVYSRGPCATEVPVVLSGPPWIILTQLFDENCELITDENGAPILTTIAL